MKRILGGAAVLVFALACPAFAVYAGTWQQEWDFESGLEGWTLYNGGVPRSYNGGGNGPDLREGLLQDTAGTACTWRTRVCPHQHFQFTSTRLGANGGSYSGKQGFVFQADVWVANLSMMAAHSPPPALVVRPVTPCLRPGSVRRAPTSGYTLKARPTVSA